MILILSCLLSVIAADTHQTPVGAAIGKCSGGNMDNWVLAATKYDLISAEILKESTVTVNNVTIDNRDRNSNAYQLDSLVTATSDMYWELPESYFSAGPVGAGGRNVARGKPAYQSSTSHPIMSSPSKAVDGNRDGNFEHGSVTHTNPGSNNYWSVNLGKFYAIDYIRIYNRIDCCQSRLSGAKLLIDNRDTGFVLNDGNIQTYPIKRMGKIVKISQPKNTALSLTEVEVYGTNSFYTTIPSIDNFGFLHVDVTKKRQVSFGQNRISGGGHRVKCSFDIPPKSEANLSITQTTRSVKLKTRMFWVNPVDKKCYKDLDTTATLTVTGGHECKMIDTPLEE